MSSKHEQLKADVARAQQVLNSHVDNKHSWIQCDWAQEQLTNAELALWQYEQECKA